MRPRYRGVEVQVSGSLEALNTDSPGVHDPEIGVWGARDLEAREHVTWTLAALDLEAGEHAIPEGVHVIGRGHGRVQTSSSLRRRPGAWGICDVEKNGCEELN